MNIYMEDIINGVSLEEILNSEQQRIHKETEKLNAKVKKMKFENEEELEFYKEFQQDYIDNGYILLTINKENLFDNLSLLKETALKLIKLNKKLNIVINNNSKNVRNDSDADYVYSKEEMQKLIDLNGFLRQNGFNDSLRFSEVAPHYNILSTPELISEEIQKLWTIEHVLKANNEIDKIVNDIKAKNLSPYETMIYIHNYLITNFEYRASNKFNDNYDAERSIVGALNNKIIVCAGYASLTKAIIDRLNNPNLKCELLGCELHDKSTKSLSGGHAQALITIKDEKYGINGTYINDATHDARIGKYTKGIGFSHFMFSVNDVLHYKKYVYVNNYSENRFDNNVLVRRKHAHSKLMKKISNYIDRKKYFKKGYIPDVVKMYGNNSKTISVETFEKAYNNILPLLGDCLTWNEIVGYSSIIASKSFDSSSENIWLNPKLEQKIMP